MAVAANTNFNLSEEVAKYAPQFQAQTTVKAISIFFIINRPDLTQDQVADIVVGIKHTFGLMAKTSGSCIGWYKQEMKKKGGGEETKAIFTKYLQEVTPEERKAILLQLVEANVENIIKAASPEQLSKFIPIIDTPETKPNAVQIAEAQALEPAKIAELPKAKKLIRKKG